MGIEIGDLANKVIQSTIHSSKVHISIFSLCYGVSPWCLDELRLIMECSRNKSTTLFLPVFFHVMPSDLRLLTPSRKSCYDSAFEEHTKKYKASTIEKWKEALHDASTFKGFIFPDDFQGFEAKLVRSIVSKVIEKLSTPMLLHGPEHPVELGEKLRQALVCMDTRGLVSRPRVRRFGIYGMGGLGKTTLAKSIYNSIHRKFECACFIQDVSESHKNVGLPGLQKDLLQQLLKPTREISIFNTGFGKNRMPKELVGKRVLVVLDDVSEKQQLDALLLPYEGCLGQGSQFVITTRDCQILELARVKHSLHMKGLSRDGALQLLNFYAFPSREEPFIDFKQLQTNTEPLVDWKRLVEKVADACQGLPLALEVLGSFLRGKDISVWENTVKVLGKEKMVNSQREVTAILRTSFDALRFKEEKEMFLDVACFLSQEPKEKAMRIWRSDYGDSDAELYINNLISKCLVNLDKNGNLTMHDLLRSMGREIVDNSGKPYWKKSHLWREEDVHRVLQKRNGTPYVRGLGWKTRKAWDTSSFTGMDELKLLVLDKVTLVGDFGNIPQELRWFQLRNFPLKFPPLPALDNVVVLDLEGCWMTSFSCGDCKLQNLKELKLSNCSDLLELSIDFSKSAKSLEVLMLNSCKSLEQLPDSICELSSSLTFLDVSWCTKLRALPDGVGKLTALQKIELDGTPLMTLPQSFGSLSSLRSLHLCHSSLRHFPLTILKLSNLAHLRLSNCESTSQLPEAGMRHLRRLVELHLSDMKGLVSLPCSISSLFILKVLNLQGCSSLRAIVELPTSLASLVVGGCTSLEYLDMSACSKLEAFPDGMETLHRLSHLTLGEHTSKQMLDIVRRAKLTSLKTLRLSQAFSEAANSMQWIQKLVSNIEVEVVVCITRGFNRTLLMDQRRWSRNIGILKKVVPDHFEPSKVTQVLCWFWEVVGWKYEASEQPMIEVVESGDDNYQVEFCQNLMHSHSRLREQEQLRVAMYRAPHPLVAGLRAGHSIRVRSADIVRGSIELSADAVQGTTSAGGKAEMQKMLQGLVVGDAMTESRAHINAGSLGSFYRRCLAPPLRLAAT